MSVSREKFEHWLKHSQRLEADLKQNPAKPTALGPAEAEPWTPLRADPFGMNWQWLGLPSRTAITMNPQSKSSSRDRANRSTWKRGLGLVGAMAASLLIGVMFGRRPTQTVGLPAQRILAMTKIDLLESQIRDPVAGADEVVRSISVPNAAMDGFMCVASVSTDGKLLFIPEPGGQIQALAGNSVSTGRLSSEWDNAAGAVVIITEKVLDRTVLAPLDAPGRAGIASNLGELQKQVERLLAEAGFRSFAIGSVPFSAP